MKALQHILYKVPLIEVIGSTDTTINQIVFDSRKVQEGDLFVATKGVSVDGHHYIDKAIIAGAKVIVSEQSPKSPNGDVIYIKTEDSQKALGILSSNFYNNPSQKLKIVGVTGTNGKTTVATLLYELFKTMGYKTGLLSTVENKIDEETIESTHTTPDALSIQSLLSEMVEKNCTHCFMEVSSHAIHQQRISGLEFDGAVFTNISHDHLDYHKTFDEYISAKKALFDQLPKKAFALVNVDDKRGMVMLQNTRATKLTFGLKSMADYKAKILSNSIQGLELDINKQDVWFKLIGEFNAYNILAVVGVAEQLGEDEQEVLTNLSLLAPVNGRFNQIVSKEKIVGIVDYAHTPDALENVLSTIEKLKGNHKVITVVGCGGNRDTTKRPLMAKIACKLSDQVILTSDNPRNEDPIQIIEEMKAGVLPPSNRKIIALPDRREAIKLAITLANAEDIVLLAGKGHETYQEVKGVKSHFDDKEELLQAFELLGK